MNNNLEEIEEFVDWNLSFNIPIYDSLKQIHRLDLIDYFIEKEKWIKEMLDITS